MITTKSIGLFRLYAVGLLLLALTASNQTSAMANELLVGPSSKISSALAIPLRKPKSFNWKTSAEVLQLRKDAVNANADLLLYRYSASREVFGKIEDKRPWWGSAGQTVFGRGQNSITGVSEESRFILNPYLLVAANSATVGIFNPEKFTGKELDSDGFPFFWSPESLTWEPREKRATASYNIRGYLTQINSSGKLFRRILPNEFSLVAYNARDLGYRYIYLDTQTSKNVVNQQKVTAPVFISQFIHCGGTCGYPGGCNNMSPFTREIDRCVLTAVPAKAVVKLWKDRPYSLGQEPDFLFTLNFR